MESRTPRFGDPPKMRFTAAVLMAGALLSTTLVTVGSAASNSLDAEPAAGADSVSSQPSTLIVEVDGQVDPAQLGAILEALAGDDIEMVDSNSRFGLLTVHATAAGASLVERLSVVDDVTESRQFKLFLEDSVAIVEGDLLRAAGTTGAGKVVAVIDSGIDTSHPGLSASIVGEACFLVGILPGDTSRCPVSGTKVAIGIGTGTHCTGPAEGCSHGSHVAGIITGSSLTVGAETEVNGVAPDIGVVSIRVMSNDADGNIPEAAALAALSHVLDLHEDGMEIASVNMSLGGPPGDCSPGPWAAPIDALNAAGIAVVAASGNTEGDPVAFPACLDGVIAVGATGRHAPLGPGFDCASDIPAQVAPFTQAGPKIDLVAPGVCIDSTVLTAYDADGIGNFNGTSMAAPHVTALLAMLDGNQTDWSVERSMELLRATGEMITMVTPNPSDRDPRYPEPRAQAALKFEPFIDAQSGFWVIAADWAKATGVSIGTGGGEFGHARTLSRAEAVTFLWRLMGSPEPLMENPFTDVSTETWYTDAVGWAAEIGVTTGTTATTFEPDADVTRGQIATFFWRLVGEPDYGADSGFSDVPVGKFYTSPVTWMAIFEITTGTSPTTFSPDDVVNRAQMITFLWRLVNTGDAWGEEVTVPDGAMF